MSTEISRIVIIGGGQAGANAALQLRQNGHAGSLILVGAENHAPYERPPLSKDVLLSDDAKVRLFADDFYVKHNVELKLGVSATGVDPHAHEVTLSNGEKLAYDKLLLATGARARSLPRVQEKLGDRAHVLRTLDDALALKAQLKPGARVLLLGAGVIGLELAASAIKLGATAEVIDPGTRPMRRALPPIMGDWLRALHEAQGTTFHFETSIEGGHREGDDVVLDLSNGKQLRGDVLVLGIGVIAETALAEDAELEVAPLGIVVDAQCRTSHPDIYAAGDVAVFNGQRTESWENANQQAAIAVHAMLGLDAPAAIVPWFWTDQFGINFQFAGDMRAETWLARGDMAQAPFMLWGLDADGVIVGAVTVNQGKDMRPAKDLIAKRVRLSSEILADPASNLRNIAKEAPAIA